MVRGRIAYICRFRYKIIFLDLDARPWDFQSEECTLRACVDRFNNRRYLSGNSGSMIRTSTGNTAATSAATGAQNANNGGGPVISDLNEYDQNLLDVNVTGGNVMEQGQYMRGYGGWDEKIELSDDFKEQYEIWLQQEVFTYQINWDSLIERSEF